MNNSTGHCATLTMKKQAPLILEIPKPCSESWAQMTPMGLGRFCAHCQKTVTDITQMSDAQVVQLFQKNTDTHCIRAFASQLNRPISLPIQEPTRFYRIAVALGLTLVMAAGADAYARPRPPLVEQNYLLNEGDTTERFIMARNTYAIRGIVFDETNNPFPGVIVMVKQGGITKGGTVTEDDGSFEIKPLQTGTYQLEISSVGYEKKLLTITKEQMLNGESLKLALKMDIDKTQVNIIIRMGGAGLSGSNNPKPAKIEYKEFDEKGRPMPRPINYSDRTYFEPKNEIEKTQILNTIQQEIK